MTLMSFVHTAVKLKASRPKEIANTMRRAADWEANPQRKRQERADPRQLATMTRRSGTWSER
jgi:hypothetical protein